jgi:preprotein translocase subunit SecE
MTTQAEAATSVLDIVKHAFSLLLVIAGVAAFYYFSEILLLYRVLAIVAIVVIALAIMRTTQVGQDVWVFMLESKQEVRKVVWPSRQDTMQTTLMVLAMVVVVGLILWFLDAFLIWAVKTVMSIGHKG